MNKFKCYICKKYFYRYKSQIRDKERACCSLECRDIKFKKSLKGENNPNFKHGKYIYQSYCGCGYIKDERAVKCSVCANVGFTVGKKNNKISKKELSHIVKRSKHILSISDKTGIKRETIAKYIKKYNIDTGHFTPGRNRRRPIEQILVYGAHPDHATVKKAIIDYELIPYVCNKCGLKDEWNGHKITLELHHKDGNNTNNLLENLEILCPNCHSQTNTHKGKNMKNKGRKSRSKVNHE